jgi:hypothetical protein
VLKNSTHLSGESEASAINCVLAARQLLAFMITKKYLQTYKSFDGDVDMWGRVKMSKDRMTDADWFEIEGILQDLTIIANGHASEEFTAKTWQHIKTSCDAPEVEQELIEMAKGRRK